jgi:hypothetical protein
MASKSNFILVNTTKKIRDKWHKDNSYPTPKQKKTKYTKKNKLELGITNFILP